MADPSTDLLNAALPHVAFDGWSDATLAAAARDTDLPLAMAKALFPRGGVDLAMAYHRAGDAAMLARIKREPLGEMRFRDRIAAAVRFRLETIEDREAVRRGTTLFALPQHAADGARALWETADHIWTALGDTSEDINWYTKRATLSGVHASTVLFWLGDDSPDHQATWEFLDRRIDDVMTIEKMKAAVNKNPVLRGLMAGPNWLLGHVRAPTRTTRTGMPGSWNRPN
ncbi:COQ9 family protein [Oceaniovalibus sp. ACAM 378]|uniref:COQ9 family protein n=1 Tax=Oceaniovalibus sp. ACAM 378 TaxID=2599923 RepID=UPI0011D77E58|nr:COQ9 family protein [Oceaniovalibus sp. ACAM 378]TYB90601.1 COQ9 family protein [Oceaniovalibus sp. ACAM 378]